jgi:hypothetical protein
MSQDFIVEFMMQGQTQCHRAHCATIAAALGVFNGVKQAYDVVFLIDNETGEIIHAWDNQDGEFPGLSGTINLETITIHWVCTEGLKCYYSVFDYDTGETENHIAEQYDFLAALSIAAHNSGMPDFRQDYPIAEKLQHKIRWIP